MLQVRNARGQDVLQTVPGRYGADGAPVVFFMGTGASPKGDRPFLDARPLSPSLSPAAGTVGATADVAASASGAASGTTATTTATTTAAAAAAAAALPRRGRQSSAHVPLLLRGHSQG